MHFDRSFIGKQRESDDHDPALQERIFRGFASLNHVLYSDYLNGIGKESIHIIQLNKEHGRFFHIPRVLVMGE